MLDNNSCRGCPGSMQWPITGEAKSETAAFYIDADLAASRNCSNGEKHYSPVESK